jgi:hypothetical protein
MKSETGRDEEEERHSKFYYQHYMTDAVNQYLQTLLGTFE